MCASDESNGLSDVYYIHIYINNILCEHIYNSRI